jgi:two-component system, NtrC family, nitrogen regulation response regulator NtrX
MSKSPHVLLVEDDRGITHTLSMIMEAEKWKITTADCGKKGQDLLRNNTYSAVLLDYSLPDMSGTEFITYSKHLYPNLPILMHTGHDSGDVGFETSKAGADAFILKGEDLHVVIGKLRDTMLKNVKKTSSISAPAQRSLDALIGESKVMKRLKEKIMKAADSNCNVLILGPNGAGKELVAAALHANSRRASKDFLIDNAAAGNIELIDSKYFGHKKGAFTGADADHIGLFEAADKCTLFIDEIGDLPLTSQSKLLRAIEYGDILPLGGKKNIKVDVRLIAATNKNLDEEVKHRRFREDLLNRLNTLVIEIPSLNERLEDIPLLASHFIKIACAKEEVTTKTITNEALALLQKTNWTGNVRQLSNVIYNAVIEAGSKETELDLTHFDRLK